MITFESHASFDASEWTRIVASCDGNPLLSPQVHRAETAERDIRFLIVKDGDLTIGCGLAVTVSRRILGWPIGPRTLSLPTALALVEDATARKSEIYHELAVFARQSGCQRLVVHRNWGDDFSEDLRLSPCIVGHGLDFTVDLSDSIEALLRKMKKNHRKNVRRAERKGFEILEDAGEAAFHRLRELQACTAERKRFGLADRDEDSYQRLYKAVYRDGPGSVLFAKLGDQYVAGLAFLAFGRKAQTVRSGSNETGNENYATYLLQFELMVRLKNQGFDRLNLGAVPAEAVEATHAQHGLYQFKNGFGGQIQLRTALDIPLKAFALAG